MRALRLSALAAAALALTACAGIPTSGPIQQGAVVTTTGDDHVVRVIARPPAPGMSPEDLVRGFRAATASPDSGYKIARQYLTDSASVGWDPSAGVRISDNFGLTLSRKGNVITFDGGLSGSIDPRGEYAVAAPGSRISVAYGVTKVDGEWRISSVPPGLVLGPFDIVRGFRTFDLYYFTRNFGTLVPAPVTLPLAAGGMATSLVRGLIAGPTPWLEPAVRTAFPEGTRLAIDAVTISDGIADVQLSNDVLIATDETRQKLSAQLVWTLRQLPEISGVRLTVNGQPLQVPGVGAVQPIGSWPLVDPDGLPDTATAYAIDKRGLLRFPPIGAATLLRIKPPLGRPGVSLDGTLVAGVTADKRTLWVAHTADNAVAVKRYTGGGELSRPSWDSSGIVWVVDRGRGLVAIIDGVPTLVQVTDLPEGVTDKDLLAVAVSRDGARIALLAHRGTRVEPYVARVERLGDNNLRVTGPRRIEGVVTEAVDVAWLDADTVVVLGSEGAAGLEVLQLPLGFGDIRHTDAETGAVSLAAAPGHPILTSDGRFVYQSSGSAWVKLPYDGASAPVYPG